MYIIVGASKGIGKYLYTELSKRGESVIGTYNSNKVEKDNFYHLNLEDEESINNFYAIIESKCELINLIICSGLNYNSFAHKTDMSSWRKVIDVNLIGTFSILSKFLPMMRSQNYGRILTFSSVVAKMGVHGTSAYSASKSALWGLNKAIAMENATKGITINSVNLGYFDIGMIQDVPESYQTIIKETIPTKKFGDPQNILNAVDFIVKSDYMNGANFDLNGLIH